MPQSPGALHSRYGAPLRCDPAAWIVIPITREQNPYHRDVSVISFILGLIEGEKCEIDMHEPRGRHFCLLAHNVVNKLAAILGHCEILNVEANEHPECIERLHKIRDLASSAVTLLQSGECETEAVTRILELENAFSMTGRRATQPAQAPRKKPRKERDACQESKLDVASD